MMTTRRMVAGLAEAVICIGGYLLCLAVFGLVVAVLHTVLGGVVQGFSLNPKGFVGGLLQFGVPTIVALWAVGRFVLPRLWPFFDRLKRWKEQEQ